MTLSEHSGRDEVRDRALHPELPKLRARQRGCHQWDSSTLRIRDRNVAAAWGCEKASRRSIGLRCQVRGAAPLCLP